MRERPRSMLSRKNRRISLAFESKPQDSKKDNKSDRAANHDQKKARGDKKDKDKSSFVIWKDKLSKAIKERRFKDKLSAHQTRDCKAKEQALHDTQAMLDATKTSRCSGNSDCCVYSRSTQFSFR